MQQAGQRAGLAVLWRQPAAQRVLLQVEGGQGSGLRNFGRQRALRLDLAPWALQRAACTRAGGGYGVRARARAAAPRGPCAQHPNRHSHAACVQQRESPRAHALQLAIGIAGHARVEAWRHRRVRAPSRQVVGRAELRPVGDVPLHCVQRGLCSGGPMGASARVGGARTGRRGVPPAAAAAPPVQARPRAQHARATHGGRAAAPRPPQPPALARRRPAAPRAASPPPARHGARPLAPSWPREPGGALRERAGLDRSPGPSHGVGRHAGGEFDE